MNMDEAFPSKYIKASDLRGQKHKLTIASLEMNEVGSDMKPIVYFDGREKGLVLNKTNAGIISSKFGPESDGWIGKEVVLYPTQTQFEGKTVPAIRVENVMEFAADSENPAPPGW